MRGWWGSAGGGGGRVLVVRRAMWTMGTQILRLSGTAQAAGAAGGGDRSPCHKVKAHKFILTGERELNPFQSVCAGGTSAFSHSSLQKGPKTNEIGSETARNKNLPGCERLLFGVATREC